MEHCNREWEILSVLSDDLQDPKQVISLWREKADLEAILADAEPEPLADDFPVVTAEYKSRLQAVARGDV